MPCFSKTKENALVLVNFRVRPPFNHRLAIFSPHPKPCGNGLQVPWFPLASGRWRGVVLPFDASLLASSKKMLFLVSQKNRCPFLASPKEDVNFGFPLKSHPRSTNPSPGHAARVGARRCHELSLGVPRHELSLPGHHHRLAAIVQQPALLTHRPVSFGGGRGGKRVGSILFGELMSFEKI